jgi:hypothetical protein
MEQQFLLFFLTLILFSGCQSGGSKTEVLLQSIADIEYIPLETTDDILLSIRR